MKKNISYMILLVILLITSGCVNKEKEEPKEEKELVTLDQIIKDIREFNGEKKTRAFIEIIREGVYIKNGEVCNYYSITKLEIMSFSERAKLYYDIENAPLDSSVVIGNKIMSFLQYQSLDDLIANGTDALEGIGVSTEIYDVENGVISYGDGSNLKSISTEKAPTKLNYIIGEKNIDLTGLVVKGEYLDGTEKIEIITENNITGFETETAGIKTITIEINGRKTTFLIRVDESVLESLEITNLPTKLIYIVEEYIIDLSGLVVMGTYSDGIKKQMTVTSSNISGATMGTEGVKNIKITIGEKSVVFNVTVIPKKLESIAIVSQPTKTSYYVGDTTISLTGLSVKGTYNDGTVKTETITTSNISGFSTTTSGTKTITVTLSGKTAIFPITVLDVVLNSIAVTTAPTKTSYYVGDTAINLTGLVVKGTYNNGVTKAETITTSNISGFITTASGSKIITVTVGGKTATFPITVLDVVLNSIAITTYPTKTSYYVGDATMSLTGLVVKGTYNNGVTKAETITTSNISGFDTTASGSKTITVTVGGKTVTFPIIVTDAIKSASFLLTKNIDILKLKQYSASFELADTSITTLVLTADGGIAPGQLIISGTSATLPKVVLDATVTKITVKALDASGNQVGITKTITLN